MPWGKYYANTYPINNSYLRSERFCLKSIIVIVMPSNTNPTIRPIHPLWKIPAARNPTRQQAETSIA